MIILYDQNHSWDSTGFYGYAVSYCDFFTYFNGTTSNRVFQDSGVQNKKVSSDQFQGENFMTWVMDDFGNTNQIKLASITSTGLTYNTSISFGSSWDYWYSGDRYLYVNYDTNFITLLTSDGTVLDTLDCSEGGISIWSRWNTFIVFTSSKARYINQANSTFQTMLLPAGSYHFIYPNSYENYPGGQHINGNFAIMDQSDFSIQIISDTNYANFNPGLDFDSGSTHRTLGKNSFTFSFTDGSGNFQVNLYDLSGTLMNSYTSPTPADYADNVNLTDGVVFFKIYLQSGVYVYGMMSSSSITTRNFDYSYNSAVGDYQAWC